MIREAVSEELPASCETVFDLVHDYEQRLTWDMLLREAFVEGNGPATNGAIAVCTGKWLVGGLSLRTVYVSFQRGKVAAVKMINTRPSSRRGRPRFATSPSTEGPAAESSTLGTSRRSPTSSPSSSSR